MAVVYRRIPRLVLKAAAISTSKRGWNKPSVQLGRNHLFKSDKTPAYCKDANQNKFDHQECLIAYITTTSTGQIIDDQKGTEKNEDYDNSYSLHVSEPSTKAYTTRSQVLLKDEHIGLNLDHRRPARACSKASKSRVYDDLITFSVTCNARAFQQYRSEYKLMCYNSERPMETPIEEAESILQKVTSSLKPSEVTEFLEKLSYLPEEKLVAILSNVEFESLCRCSTSNLQLYTNSEMLRILGAFVCFEVSLPRSVLTEYMREFSRRACLLSTNELLLVADTFRCMSFSIPEFLDIMYSCMLQRYLDLNLPQVIQLIYIIGKEKYAPPELLEKTEAMVLRYLKSLNLEEIGTICEGYYKTGHGLSQDLMKQLGNILVENVEQMSYFALMHVLKMFSFIKLVHLRFLRRVGEDAYKLVRKTPVQVITQYVLAFASMHVLHEDLMDAVALAIPDKVSYCRSKDLANLLWSFGALQYKPLNVDVLYFVFVNHIRKNTEEFRKNPKHLFKCLLGLALCEQFPLDLISIALNETVIIKTTNRSIFELKKYLFTIAGTVEIECPQYTGNTISPEFRKYMTDMLVELSTWEIHRRPEVNEVIKLLELVVGGPQCIKEHMILPHTRLTDLEVHLDVNKKPVPINSEELNRPYFKYHNVTIIDDLIVQLSNTSTLTPTSSKNSDIKNSENPNILGELSMMTCSEQKNKNPPGQSEVIKLAIQITNRNQYIYESKQLLGFHVMRRRQLRKLGYVVVEVPFWEWFPLVKCPQYEKLAYLHHKVFSSV